MFSVFSFFLLLHSPVLSAAMPPHRGRSAGLWRPGCRIYCEPCNPAIFRTPRTIPKSFKRFRKPARISGDAGRPVKPFPGVAYAGGAFAPPFS